MPVVSPGPFWTKPIIPVGLFNLVTTAIFCEFVILPMLNSARRDIPGGFGGYRHSFPLHPIDNQSPRWGPRITLAPRGQEFHLHEAQVIKDASLTSFLIPVPSPWHCHLWETDRTSTSLTYPVSGSSTQSPRA